MAPVRFCQQSPGSVGPRGFFLLFVVLVLPLMGIYAETPASTTAAYQIGVILPLSGKAASVGQAIKNGIELAYAELPAETAAGLQLHYEDDASESKNSVAAYKRLRTSAVSVALCVYSNAGHSIAPLAEKDKTVLVAIALDRSIAKNRRHVFTLYANSDSIAAELVAEAVRLKQRRIGIITTAHEGNIAMRQALERALPGQLEVKLSSEVLPASPTSVRSSIGLWTASRSS